MSATRKFEYDQYVTLDCGCLYVRDGKLLHGCEEHGEVTCGKCGFRATLTPIGVLCSRCTFGRE